MWTTGHETVHQQWCPCLPKSVAIEWLWRAKSLGFLEAWREEGNTALYQNLLASTKTSNLKQLVEKRKFQLHYCLVYIKTINWSDSLWTHWFYFSTWFRDSLNNFFFWNWLSAATIYNVNFPITHYALVKDLKAQEGEFVLCLMFIRDWQCWKKEKLHFLHHPFPFQNVFTWWEKPPQIFSC